jgi:hypothetical protein
MAAKPGTTSQQQAKLLELSIVARIWNGLVQSQQKPSKYLGRRALKHAWKGLELESKIEGDAQKLLWLREFERLLFYNHQDDEANTNNNNNNNNNNNVMDHQDNDAALLWDADGGKAELARRQKRRQQAATLRKSTLPEEPSITNTSTTPRIEEIDES